MSTPHELREHLANLLAWQDAHASFDTAVADVPPGLRGRRADGLPYSPWELVEHLRLTQADILEFCVDPAYRDKAWPADYWPGAAEPPDPDAWDRSVAAYRADREALRRMAMDPSVDLFARIPHGQGQTYLREIVLAADHAAYHVGQLVVVLRLLDAWE
jgi:DinB superfamily